jgi:hypothetical protein
MVEGVVALPGTRFVVDVDCLVGLNGVGVGDAEVNELQAAF